MLTDTAWTRRSRTLDCVSLDAHSWVEHVPGWLTGAGSTFDELPRTARWSSASAMYTRWCSSRA